MAKKVDRDMETEIVGGQRKLSVRSILLGIVIHIAWHMMAVCLSSM